MRKFYRTLQLYRYTDGDFDTPAGYTLNKTFKGIIQVPNNSKRFYNAKDGESVDGILFCNIGESFQSKDKIKDPDSGQSFFLSGYGSQPLGVTGIKSHHAEYKLVFDGVTS